MHIPITYIDTSDPDYRPWQLDPDQPMLICIDCHKLVRRNSVLQHRCRHCNMRKPAAKQRRTRRNYRKHRNRKKLTKINRIDDGYIGPRAWAKQQDLHCRMCGLSLSLESAEVDHIVPLWAGGVHHPDNFQILCADCHRLKTQAEALWKNESDINRSI